MDLQDLLALIQSFQKTLSTERSNNEIKASLHVVRRRLWQTEARIVKLGWPADFERQWREVRDRLNIISDDLGLPRVIDLAIRTGSDRGRFREQWRSPRPAFTGDHAEAATTSDRTASRARPGRP